MTQSIRMHVLGTTSALLAAGVATFAAAAAIMTSGPAFGARSSRASDRRHGGLGCGGFGKCGVGMPAGLPGYRQLRAETATAGRHMQIAAKVPAATRIERTFNSSIKAMPTRTVRGEDKVVAGTVVFDAR